MKYFIFLFKSFRFSGDGPFPFLQTQILSNWHIFSTGNDFLNYPEALNLNMVLGAVRGAELYVLVKQSHLVNNENMPKRALLNYLLNENTTKSTVYYNFLSSTTV